jgi:hypothetical protein
LGSSILLCGARISQFAAKRARSSPWISPRTGVNKMFKQVWSAIGVLVLAAAMALHAPPAQAQGGVRVGTLNCNVASGWGFVIGSSRQLRCVFSGGPGQEDHYTGTITRFGADIGFTRGGVLVWTVVAPTNNLAPGALAGSFAGATATAAVGVGLGANVLVGGSGNTIALQPLSIEGNTGLNVAAGIGAITLRYVGSAGR